jgi:hypothetical protein
MHHDLLNTDEATDEITDERGSDPDPENIRANPR